MGRPFIIRNEESNIYVCTCCKNYISSRRDNKCIDVVTDIGTGSIFKSVYNIVYEPSSHSTLCIFSDKTSIFDYDSPFETNDTQLCSIAFCLLCFSFLGWVRSDVSILLHTQIEPSKT